MLPIKISFTNKPYIIGFLITDDTFNFDKIKQCIGLAIEDCCFDCSDVNLAFKLEEEYIGQIIINIEVGDLKCLNNNNNIITQIHFSHPFFSIDLYPTYQTIKIKTLFTELQNNNYSITFYQYRGILLKIQKQDQMFSTKDIFIYNVGNQERENINMSSNSVFNFGPINNTNLKISINGIAFRNKEGRYVTYDSETNSLTDVTDFTFDINNILW